METPFNISFPNGNTAKAIRVFQKDKLSEALRNLGLHSPRRNLVLIGGAAGLTEADFETLRPLFIDVLCPLARSLDLCILDGGTDAGVMRLMGLARAESGGNFPLIGIATEATVSFPGATNARSDAASLESHHTQILLVPGGDWGDEAPWLSGAAIALTRGASSVAVLINGGEFARKDVDESLSVGRPLMVVAGTGRLADELAVQPPESKLVTVAELSEGTESVFRAISEILEKENHG